VVLTNGVGNTLRRLHSLGDQWKNLRYHKHEMKLFTVLENVEIYTKRVATTGSSKIIKEIEWQSLHIAMKCS
jgi:predicted ATP-dependent endonuclease of OLD family